MKQQKDSSKKFEVPHSLVIIIVVMLFAAVLTYIVPAGIYERFTNEAGKTIVDPLSFHYIESTPVNPITILSNVFSGMTNASGIIFSLMLSSGGLGIILHTGMFQGVAGTLGRKVNGKEWIVIALIMTIFAVLCVPINLNTFIPLAPLGLVIAASIGMDAIVGVSCIMLGGAVGFSCGAMNLSNTGTAQSIAELATFSGMSYRLVCMVPFLIVTVMYVVRYGNRIKKDPTKSYVYGLELGNDASLSTIPEFTSRHIPVAIVTVIGMGILIVMAIQGKMTNASAATLFMYMGLLGGLVYGLKPNEMCKVYINGMKSMAPTAGMIGFAYGITIILTKGQIMDTIVHSLAGVLNYVPGILQAPAMFLMHIVINLFITSGSGQAAASMPIMVPVADLVGMNRQIAVLAFNFGDGFCNNILPHAAATMGFVGAAGIPFGRWFQYIVKLFALWVAVGIIMLMIATAIGYA